MRETHTQSHSRSECGCQNKREEDTKEESLQRHQDRSVRHEMPRDKMNLMKLSHKDFKVSMPRMFKDISKGIMSINNKKF